MPQDRCSIKVDREHGKSFEILIDLDEHTSTGHSTSETLQKCTGEIYLASLHIYTCRFDRHFFPLPE